MLLDMPITTAMKSIISIVILVVVIMTLLAILYAAGVKT